VGLAVNADDESGRWWLWIDRPADGGIVEVQDLHDLLQDILRGVEGLHGLHWQTERVWRSSRNSQPRAAASRDGGVIQRSRRGDPDDWSDLVKPEWLSRRIALDEYFAESLECVRSGRLAQSAVDADRAALEALAGPGDEWWEWLLGTEPLRQLGGLVLVRDGRVAWARLDWIS
jgi:hypothetical protein